MPSGDDETREQPRDGRHRRPADDRRPLAEAGPQLEQHVAGRLPALLGILREAARDDVVEPAGRDGCRDEGGGGVMIQDRRDDAGLAVPGNARSPVAIS